MHVVQNTDCHDIVLDPHLLRGIGHFRGHTLLPLGWARYRSIYRGECDIPFRVKFTVSDQFLLEEQANFLLDLSAQKLTNTL